MENILPSFHSKPMFVFESEVQLFVSNKWSVLFFFGSCFLIQSTSLCLSIGQLRPLTFEVIIEGYVVIPVILLLLEWLILSYSSFAYLFI
jgi:hypothetical protein